MLLEFQQLAGRSRLSVAAAEPHIPFVTTLLRLYSALQLHPGCCRVSEDAHRPRLRSPRPGAADLCLLQLARRPRSGAGWPTSNILLARFGGHPLLLFPVEDHLPLARNMSLTVRLYANMLASDLLTLVFFSIFPLVLPIACISWPARCRCNDSGLCVDVAGAHLTRRGNRARRVTKLLRESRCNVKPQSLDRLFPQEKAC